LSTLCVVGCQRLEITEYASLSIGPLSWKPLWWGWSAGASYHLSVNQSIT